MKIYLAGGIAGNMNWAWKKAVKNPNVTLETFEKVVLDEVIEKDKENDGMKIYLAGTAPWRSEGLYDGAIRDYHPFILESFYYVDDDTEKLLPLFGDFILDSGAFTFISNIKKTGGEKSINWEQYVDKYGEYIKKNNIDKFLELDIDYLVGYDKVKEYRKRLEIITGKQPIPVFHKTRDLTEFQRMCDEYKYVAIGASGINTDSAWVNRHPEALEWFITMAHKHNCKIHGLGFTRLNLLTKLHFDSVDSTAWVTGNRYGFVYKFNGKTMIKVTCPKGKRLGNPRKVALINYIEWLKFQKYAERNL